MTYRELQNMIRQMPDSRKDDDVTVFVSGVGEAYPALAFGDAAVIDQQGDIAGVLDDGHFIVKI